MGDAGPPTPLPEERAAALPRDIHVLVTGFGPFKSFTTNPSWLIAASLPQELAPLRPDDPAAIALQSATPAPAPSASHHPFAALFGRAHHTRDADAQPASQPLRPPNPTPYRIHIHTYPHPVRVAYAQTSVVIPVLLDGCSNGPLFAGSPGPITFDHVLHIGLASGRDSYTLETLAHRNDYIIPDIDDQNAFRHGPQPWAAQGVPNELHVGWHPADVLRRWERDVAARYADLEAVELNRQRQELGRPRETHVEGLDAQPQPRTETHTQVGVRSWMASHGMLLRSTHHSAASSPPTATATATVRVPRRPVVKLSRDAGRYLCEFIFMCSLVYRYLESRSPQTPKHSPAPAVEADPAHENVGKVAFLHVPNGIDECDVAKGVLVAECAIRSLVASWEAGWRNEMVYAPRVAGPHIASGDAFETKGTGDR